MGRDRAAHAAQPRDLGIFDAREAHQLDTLSQFEQWWSKPVQCVLLAFGFANAGVPFSQIGPGTYYVLIGLLVGKPVGVVLFSRLARTFGARLPRGLRVADLILVGITASIGRGDGCRRTDDGQTIGPREATTRRRKPITAAQRKAVGERMKRYLGRADEGGKKRHAIAGFPSSRC